MEKKIGIYLCTGCGIGEALDMEKITTIAQNSLGAAVVKSSEHLCGPEGAQMITDDIANEGVNTTIICACSPRVNYDVFKWDNTIVERVNYREHIVWSHAPNDEDTQAMAEDYLRMAAAKAKRIELPEPAIMEGLSKTILVIGGGVAGMTATLEAAKAGYESVIVEKEAHLGGYLNKMYKKLPGSYPYARLEEPGASTMAMHVENNPKITVHKSSQVEKIAGQPGLFDVTITTPNGPAEFKAGAVVMATGWKPYDASKLEAIGYGKHLNVVTNVE
ncbi:MAG: CoB--CoM heterodisulfide reductase iron-sulfur subunit A family protein, partial [Rubrobacteridae bacterium]|nr:CoB--CoM heterodisulfide reductase iron-sulfur subunit A family protein [Rubrobacteridae bacterium]